MTICKANTNDPLLSLLLTKRVNPLMFARRETPIGVIYVIDKRKASAQQIWKPDTVLASPLPAIGRTLATSGVAQIEAVTSGLFELGAGVGILGRLFGEGPKAKAKAGLSARGVRGMSIKLGEVTGERWNVDDLQIALADRPLRPLFSERAQGSRLYMATGAWSAKLLKVTALDGDQAAVNVEAEMESAVSGEANLSVSKDARGALFIEAAEPLFFGAELMELRSEIGGLSLKDYRPNTAIASESERVVEQALARVFDDDEDAVLQLDNPE